MVHDARAEARRLREENLALKAVADAALHDAVRAHNEIAREELLARVMVAVRVYNDRAREELLARVIAQDARAFELLVADILRAEGLHDVVVTQQTRDGGIDVRGVRRDPQGVLLHKIAVQVKRYSSSPIGPRDIQALRGALRPDEIGMFVTTSRFTQNSKREAEREGVQNIDLVDGHDLVELLVRHKLGVEERTLKLIRVPSSP
jgi:restriction system protein